MHALERTAEHRVDAALGSLFAAVLSGARVALPHSMVGVAQSLRPIPLYEEGPVELDLGAAERREESTFDSRAFLAGALKRLGLTPESLQGQTPANPGEKKRDVKYELKRHDTEFRKVHHRSPAQEEKEPMRPLYVYYRRLKASLATDEPEEPLESQQNHVNLIEQRLAALQEEKNQVRTKLQTFQDQFVREHGRKIKYHSDIGPIDRDYRMYKQIKEDIAQLETQLRSAR